jgi:hypothetical protein
MLAELKVLEMGLRFKGKQGRKLEVFLPHECQAGTHHVGAVEGTLKQSARWHSAGCRGQG